jgi:hypothetical protein
MTWERILLVVLIAIAFPLVARWTYAALYVAFMLFIISLPIERDGALLRLQRRAIAEWRSVGS